MDLDKLSEQQKLGILLVFGLFAGLAVKFVGNMWFHITWIIVTLGIMFFMKKKKD